MPHAVVLPSVNSRKNHFTYAALSASAARKTARGLPNPLRSRVDPSRQRPSPETCEVYDET